MCAALNAPKDGECEVQANVARCDSGGSEDGEVRPLNVCRLQCTNAIRILLEATSNNPDKVPQALLDYLVVKTTHTDQQMPWCTSYEIASWMLMQLIERVKTGQIWTIAKVHLALHELLWRGSSRFVTNVQKDGMMLFDFRHLKKLILETPQERPPEPSFSSTYAAKGNAPNAGPSSPASSSTKKQASKTCKHGLEDHMLNYLGYLSALCEYRAQYGYIVDLALGKLVMDKSGSWGSGEDVRCIYYATLELLKSTAADDPGLPLENPIVVEVLTHRMSDARTLHSIAIDLLGKMLLQLFEKIHNLEERRAVTGKKDTSSALAATKEPPVTATARTAASGAAKNPSSSSLSSSSPPATANSLNTAATVAVVATNELSEEARALQQGLHGWYHALYQLDRTISLLQDFYAALKGSSGMTSQSIAELRRVPSEALSTLRHYLRELEPQSGAMSGGSNSPSPANPPVSPGSSDAFATAEAVDTSSEALRALFLGQVRALKTLPTSVECYLLLTTIDELLQQENAMGKATHPKSIASDPNSTLAHNGQGSDGCSECAGVTARFSDFGPCTGSSPSNSGTLQSMINIYPNAAPGRQSSSSSQKIIGVVQHSEDGSTTPLRVSDGHGAKPVAHGSRICPDSAAGASVDRGTRSGTFILRRSLQPKSALRLEDGAATGSTTTTLTEAERDTKVIEVSAELQEKYDVLQSLLQDDDIVVVCNERCSCNRMKLADRFQVIRDNPLGTGSYGTVYRAWDELQGCYLAAKEMPIGGAGGTNRGVAVREVLKEYTILTELNHPNIVRVVAFMVVKDMGRIFMEWMPSGSIQEVLKRNGRPMLRHNVIARYVHDALSGLDYLHHRGVLHRDVKPGNMLLSADGTLKLSDFGSSSVLSGELRTLESAAIMGTAPYMAPEAVQGIYSPASDIWALGCSVVEMITALPPWTDLTTGARMDTIPLLYRIGNLNDSTNLERPHSCLTTAPAATAAPSSPTGAGHTDDVAVSVGYQISDELHDFLDRIFVVERKKRATAAELLQHPFVQKYKRLWDAYVANK